MRISDWSSDVCSSDLPLADQPRLRVMPNRPYQPPQEHRISPVTGQVGWVSSVTIGRSEEHTSELQSLMRISYAVFCLTKKTNQRCQHTHTPMGDSHHHQLNNITTITNCNPIST